MIVELFGPPGAGKTTFCHQLAQHLRTHGHVVELALSRRPAEPSARAAAMADPKMVRHALAILPRIARPTVELLYLSLAPQKWPGCLRYVAAFGRLLPQTSLVGGVRLAQYLIRLHSAWRRAERAGHVVIYDQAFIQAVASAALGSRASDQRALEAALDLVPQADLLIEIDAPSCLLQARISERIRKQSRLERVFERDTRLTARSVRLFRAIHDRLDRGDRRLITVRASDPASIPQALDQARDLVDEFAARGKNVAAEPAPALSRSTTCLGQVDVVLMVFALSTLQAIAPGGLHAMPRQAPQHRALHYASGGNFSEEGRFAPADHGFNLADVASPDQLAALPKGVKALVWVGQCEGVDDRFRQRVLPFLGDTRVFGFYLMDDPDPLGRWGPPCPPARLQAEADWIRQQDAGVRTFVALMNMGTSDAPSYFGSYRPQNSHVDLFGIGAYPCRGAEGGGCDFEMIDRFVEAAVRWGIPRDRIVPIYQTFGAGEWRDDRGDRYAFPSAEEAATILRRWARAVPMPEFDYAYSWGTQRGDRSLATAPELASLFRHHNTAEPLEAGVSDPANASATMEAPNP